MAVWLDATDTSTITLNGTTVSSWRNKGNAGAGNATQGTAANQPLYVSSAINGLPALRGRHDGTNASELNIADSAALDYTSFALFVVLQRITDLGLLEAVISKFFTPNRECRLCISATDILSLDTSANGTAAVTTTVGSALAVNTPIIVQSSYSLASTTQSVTYNNVTAATTSQTGIFAGAQPLSIFSTGSITSPFAGDIGEVLFYTKALSTTETAYVRKYLGAKWGIPL